MASLKVVLYHTSANLTDKLNIRFCGKIFYFGSAGVDVFFVLSGFIITYSRFKLLNDRANIVRSSINVLYTYSPSIKSSLLYSWSAIDFPAYYPTHYSLDICNIISA